MTDIRNDREALLATVEDLVRRVEKLEAKVSTKRAAATKKK